jgi:4-hydroxy-tetrahydrodipicolinate reductase
VRVGLVGFGRTGRSVATVILENKSARLEWVIRRSSKLEHRSVPEFLGIESPEPGLIYCKDEFVADQLLDERPVDAIVDFSSEDGIDYYGKAAAERGIAIVCAISQFSQQRDSLFQELANSTRVLWSPNITIGINFLLLAAQRLQKIAPYTDIEIIEEHFRDKQEISGTAVRIAEGLGVDSDQIKVVRAGGIIGTHQILFGFPYQTVRLTHESISREAFGNGALFAVEHLLQMPNGFYRMEDLLSPYFQMDND